jgi:hypothetical protein
VNIALFMNDAPNHYVHAMEQRIFSIKELIVTNSY